MCKGSVSSGHCNRRNQIVSLLQKEYIVIRGYGSVSPLGHTRASVTTSCLAGTPGFKLQDFNGINLPVGALSHDSDAVLHALTKEKKAYQVVDRSVLMAVYAARQAVTEAGWTQATDIAVNIGSSRGATGLFEQYVEEFLAEGTVPSYVSPVTTLGNISSWVAQDLSLSGPTISHSVTCSTGIQAIANAFAWLRSGMATKMLAGASEAPLTPFTIAQMKAIGIYSDDVTTPYPCRPLNAAGKNTFVLGEGAAVFALEKVTEKELSANTANPVIIESVGFGFESIKSKTGISREGYNFQVAVKDALLKANSPLPVDLVLMHAPGTVAGDSAELNALRCVFQEQDLPMLCSPKWLTGHTLGAAACLNLEHAIHILQHQSVPSFPYPALPNEAFPKVIRRILITAAGFGGNAAAMIVSRKAN